LSNHRTGRAAGAQRAQEAHLPEPVEQPIDTIRRHRFRQLEDVEPSALLAHPHRHGQHERPPEPRNVRRQPERTAVHGHRVILAESQNVGLINVSIARSKFIRNGRAQVSVLQWKSYQKTKGLPVLQQH